MKKQFREYYPLTKKEIKEIWKDGVFILDANALLGLYRYSEKTSKELLKILEKLKNKLWLPHQSALEFHRNRMKVIYEQKAAYKILQNIIDAKSKTFLEGIESVITRHPFIQNQAIVKKIQNYISRVKKDIGKMEDNHPKLHFHDLILEQLDKLFDKNIGKPYKFEELEKLYAEGEKRYAHEIPPGYGDILKDQEDKTHKKKFGDFIIWKQTLEFAKAVKKPIIIITDERRKGDWWEEAKGRIICPRFEMIREMRDIAGVGFHMYSVSQFILFAKSELNLTIEKDTLDEVKRQGENNKEVNVSDLISESDLVSALSTDKSINYSLNLSDEITSGIVDNKEEDLVNKPVKKPGKNRKT